jgi:glycosyltransferase involved in cell wall biosynthesis
MRIAFYAPLKPPGHPVPSGDRRMARLLSAALVRAGHKVQLASRLRAFDGAGDPARQERIRRLGDATAARLIARYRAAPAGQRPQLWFTYHPYYKAPDWIGPAVTGALDIPYVVAEASHAPKRAEGPWGTGHAQAAIAIMAAERVFCLNPIDRHALEPLVAHPDRLVLLPPFLDPAAYGAVERDTARARAAARWALPTDTPWLIAVAMMRPGDKLKSYRVLGEALSQLLDAEWRLIVVGDGKARAEVEAALAPLGPRVAWAGAQDPEALPALYAAADICVWPAINEAYGMALLEAQAAGLPVVAGAERGKGAGGGVAAIIADGETGLLTPVGEPAPFATAIGRLLADAALRTGMGAAARRRVVERHGLDAAAARLDAVLSALLRDRAGPSGGDPA